MEDKIRNIIAEVLDRSPEDINEESGPGNVEMWDSMNHLKILMELERELGFKFDQSELGSLINFRVICATIELHLDD